MKVSNGQTGRRILGFAVVAGVLALFISNNPGRGRADYLDCLFSTATNIDAQNPGYAAGDLGHGIDTDAGGHLVTERSAHREARDILMLEPDALWTHFVPLAIPV